MHVQRALRLEDVIVYERLSYEAYFFLQPTNSSECLMFQEKQKKKTPSLLAFLISGAL